MNFYPHIQVPFPCSCPMLIYPQCGGFLTAELIQQKANVVSASFSDNTGEVSESFLEILVPMGTFKTLISVTHISLINTFSKSDLEHLKQSSHSHSHTDKQTQTHTRTHFISYDLILFNL